MTFNQGERNIIQLLLFNRTGINAFALLRCLRILFLDTCGSHNVMIHGHNRFIIQTRDQESFIEDLLLDR